MSTKSVSAGFFCLGVALLTAINSTSASTLQIQLSGIDLTYDGTAIFDAGDSALAGGTDTSKADPLETVTFLQDGSQLGVLTAPPAGTDSIYLDLYIPEVVGIPEAGGSVTTDGDPAGTLELLIPGIGLSLELGEAEVIYVPALGGSLRFVFAGAVADIVAQSLPFGLEIGDPVSVSLSTQMDNSTFTSNGTYLTGFSSSGTGEITGIAIPEPHALLLLTGCALLTLGKRLK